MFEDSTFWLFVAPGLLLGLYAQARIKANYVRYSAVATSGGIAGAQVARALLDSRGLHSVRIEATPGMLSDHYDPQSKTLRLSPEVYYTPSLAAAGIAAHETGHALQDAAGYLPLKARSLIVPAVQLSAKIAPWLFIAGVLLGANYLAWAGVLLFGAQTLFTLITLPVEFDASARAEQLLVSQGIIRGEQQVEGIEKVLGAAAWTYVAGAVSSVGSFFYFAYIVYSMVRRNG
jgi:uncharacterized protein